MPFFCDCLTFGTTKRYFQLVSRKQEREMKDFIGISCTSLSLSLYYVYKSARAILRAMCVCVCASSRRRVCFSLSLSLSLFPSVQSFTVRRSFLQMRRRNLRVLLLVLRIDWYFLLVLHPAGADQKCGIYPAARDRSGSVSLPAFHREHLRILQSRPLDPGRDGLFLVRDAEEDHRYLGSIREEVTG